MADPLPLLRATFGCALGLVLAAALVAAPARAALPATGGCVLHVSGAKPPPLRSTIFMKVKGPPPNMDDPATKAFQYNPVTRALTLTDAELKTLFPADLPVKIVRHNEGLTKAGLKAARGLLFPRQSACHAELILSDVFAIFPNRAEASSRAGPIGALLVGGQRVEIIFTFRRFEGTGERPLTIRHRRSGRLPSGDPAAPLQEVAEGLKVGTSAAFAEFVNKDVVPKRRAR
ncbi:MAG TPA: hypothetical protein VF727_16365 [Allosphingosinicella sp.]|jgi:hypothetical protein